MRSACCGLWGLIRRAHCVPSRRGFLLLSFSLSICMCMHMYLRHYVTSIYSISLCVSAVDALCRIQFSLCIKHRPPPPWPAARARARPSGGWRGGGVAASAPRRRARGARGLGPVNLAGVRSAQPVPTSPRPPRAARRPAAARAPRTTPGCTPRPRRGARLGPPNRYSAARATRTGARQRTWR